MTKKHLQDKVKQAKQYAEALLAESERKAWNESLEANYDENIDGSIPDIEWDEESEKMDFTFMPVVFDEESKKIDFTLMPVEFHDVVLVLQQAHESGKYEKNGWQEGIKFDEDSNNSSKQRHLDDLRQGLYIDEESGLDADLHLACRALMSYTLRKRGKL